MCEGHLAQDCFHRPGDKAYELIDDSELTSSSTADASHSSSSSKNKKVGQGSVVSQYTQCYTMCHLIMLHIL